MELGRELLAVAFVLGILWWILRILRNKGFAIGPPSRSGVDRKLELLERMSLTTSHSVHLLRADDRIYVIGVHASGFTVLGELAEGRGRLP